MEKRTIYDNKLVVFILFFCYFCGMKKKKSDKKREWDLILKYKMEVFDLKEHHNYNEINPILPEETEENDPFDFLTLDNKKHEGRTATPYIEKIPSSKTDFNTKHVEVGYFTPNRNILNPQIVDEETWLKEGVNVFNSTSVNRTTIVLEKNKDKLKLSIFKFAKSRQVGHRYFAKHSKDIHITFNFKTKNFFITTSKFGSRKRNTTTTKNDFQKIVSTLNPLTDVNILNKLTWFDGGTMAPDTFSEDLKLFLINLQQKLKEELQVNISFKKGFGTGLGDALMKWFIKQWKIKVPNDYYQYLIAHYPGIRYLRKCNMNLVRTILHKKKLKGKYYIKLLNTCGTLNLTDLKELEEIFGERHVKQLPLSFIKTTNANIDIKYESSIVGVEEMYDYTLTNYEKLNLIKVLKHVSNSSFLNQLYDHFRIKNKLWGFGIKKRIKAKTLKQFEDEHLEWSNLIHLCERNKETVYQYEKEFVTAIEQNIRIGKRVGKPTQNYEVKILKSDLDYFDEGQHQHHCVRSYVDRYKSLIISIRKGEERMTSEFAPNGATSLGFVISPSSNSFVHIQSQMKFNQPPSEDWQSVQKILIRRLMEYVEHNPYAYPIIHISNKVSGKKEKLVWNEENGFVSEEMKRENYALDDLPF